MLRKFCSILNGCVANLDWSINLKIVQGSYYSLLVLNSCVYVRVEALKSNLNLFVNRSEKLYQLVTIEWSGLMAGATHFWNCYSLKLRNCYTLRFRKKKLGAILQFGQNLLVPLKRFYRKASTWDLISCKPDRTLVESWNSLTFLLKKNFVQKKSNVLEIFPIFFKVFFLSTRKDWGTTV